MRSGKRPEGKKQLVSALLLGAILSLAQGQENAAPGETEADSSASGRVERPLLQAESLPPREENTGTENSAGDINRASRRAIDAAETSTEKHRREIAEEAGSQLFNMDIWNTDVSLYMSGYWKGSLSVNWGIANTPLGTAPETKDSPLLFTQEADLTLSLWIWQKWFLEVSFIDDYDLNTYRAGYQGFPGETVQYVGVGNTGLDFPVFPYLDLGGDSPSSLGAYGRFGSDELTFHTLVRYDAAAREERIFVGNRERSFSTLIPNKPLRGRSFVLPDENTGTITVYLEDKNGPFSGGGRRWRLAKPSEYAASSHNGTVELVREHSGMVAVSYSGGATYLASMGNYAAPGSGFLREVQEHFDDTPAPAVKLEDYPQPGQQTAVLGTPANIPAVLNIGGVSVLVIYEPGTFSPFERQSRYQAPSANTEDAALIRLSNGERFASYEVLAVSSLVSDISMYSLTGDDTNLGVFEIVTASGRGRNRRAPETMWPLVNQAEADFPELYLPGSPPFTEDIRLRFTNYGAAGAYTIGTDVIPGSVQVYRGGILDSQVSYDPGSGTVTLASPVGFNETIRISYLKRSQERRLGSLAAGLGLIYKPEDSPLSVEAGLGLRWNVSSEAYTEEGASSPGTVGFGAKTSWNYDRLKASLSLGLGFEQPDTTGLYRAAGMEGRSEIVLGVSIYSGFISEIPAQVDPAFPSSSITPPPGPLPPGTITPLVPGNRVDLVYRNYRKTDWLGSSELDSINSSAPVVSGLKGPYPARDGDMDIFAAEFENLYGGEWTGFQVPLGRDGELLEQAKAIVVPIRFYNADSTPNILVAVQFGVLAAEGSGGGENPGHIVEAPLFYGSVTSAWINSNNTTGRNVIIYLTDEMRRKLQGANQMRILVINTNAAGTAPFSNRLLTAKPFIYGASWRAITTAGGSIKTAPDGSTGSVKTAEVSAPDLRSSKISRLHDSGSNHVLQIEWDTMNAAGADGRTSSVPLSTYRVLSFYLKGNNTSTSPGGIPDNASFRFFVARGPEAYGDPGKRALDLTVAVPSSGTHIFNDKTWHNVEIHYGKGSDRLLIDGAEYGGPYTISYRPSVMRQSDSGAGDFAGDGQSAYMAAFFESTGPPSSGTFYIDEICLEDPSPSYRINGGATLDWRHPEALVTIGDTAVVSGAAFNTALESAARGDPFNSKAEVFTGLQSRSGGQISVLDTRLSGNLNFMLSNDVSYWSAGHGVARSFGPFSFSETFNTAPPPNDETMNHQLNLRLGTPLFGTIASSIIYQHRKLNRTWSASTGLSAEQDGHPGFTLEAGLSYLEKTEKPRDWMPNYAGTWAQSWTAMVPDDGSGFDSAAGKGIQNRNARSRAGFSLKRLPVGVDLSFEGNSSVSIPMEQTQSASSARIDVPFVAGPIKGTFRSQRDISRSLVYAGRDTGDDLYQYGLSLSHSNPLWREVPVYALFDPDLDSAMDNTLSNYDKEADNTRFREILGLNLLFPERYDTLSLIVPVSHFTQLDRTMSERLDTRLDVFTISSGFGFSSVNLFGAMGSRPVFSFYRNDELRHSVTGVVSIPKNEDPLWRLQTEQRLGVYGFKGAELALANTYTISTTGWIESFGLLWTVPREKTLLSALYGAGMGKLSGRKYFPALSELAETEYERFFRESLDLVIDKSTEYAVYTVAIGHESVVRIMGKLTLTGFAKFTLERNEQIDSLGLMLSFGTTMNVSF